MTKETEALDKRIANLIKKRDELLRNTLGRKLEKKPKPKKKLEK